MTANAKSSRRSRTPADARQPSARIDTAVFIRRHLRFGWWSLLVFITLGAVLETMHGFKIGFYLDVANETRRLMWRLAHAHRVLLAVIHIVFAATVRIVTDWSDRPRTTASRSLMAASLMLPGGFFLGGLVIYDGDPGLGIALVPPGAALLFLSVLLTALAMRKA
jgi:hypothetical protein